MRASCYLWFRAADEQRDQISGAATASFVYDALGGWMSKTVNGVTTQLLYDGLNPVQELNASNGVTANLLTGLGIDQYFARTDSSGTMAFLRDALGSTVGLVNSADSIDTSYTYEPFGNTTISGSSSNAFQFTGRENDGTGLYYYRARYYSPTFQRFVSQDPIGFLGGNADLYSYALNNPINLSDPQGLWTLSIGFGGSVGLGGFGNITGGFGIVIDGHGTVAFYLNGGAGVVGAVGGALSSGGITIGVSNADSVCDLQGPFGDFTLSAGDLLGGSASIFGGPSPDGTVIGTSITLGEGAGMGYGSNITATGVIPLLHLSSVF